MTSNIFHNHLVSIDEAYDDERWSPMMRKAMNATSIEPERRIREKESATRAFKKEEEAREKVANKYLAKFKDATGRDEDNENWKRAHNRKLAKLQKDMDRFKARLKREFKDMLVDSVSDMAHDDPNMSFDLAVENSIDFDIESMVRMELGEEEFARLQEVALWYGGGVKAHAWDWRGWLTDVMASEVYKHEQEISSDVAKIERDKYYKTLARK